jgi:SAM-dependent methyltransferase
VPIAPTCQMGRARSRVWPGRVEVLCHGEAGFSAGIGSAGYNAAILRICISRFDDSEFRRGLHAAPGRAVDISAYDRWVGRWSGLFVPAVVEAAEVTPECRVLDVSTGTGEAASRVLPIVGPSGLVVGADISPAMLKAARDRLREPSFWPVAADGQALPFRDGSFDAVICQLGLQFFPDLALGLKGRSVQQGPSKALRFDGQWSSRMW